MPLPRLMAPMTLFPFLFFILTPPELQRASLLAGRAYSAAAHTRQAGKIGSRNPCAKRRFLAAQRGVILAISTATRSSISASTASSFGVARGVQQVGGDRLQPHQRRGAERPAQQLDLELVQRVERDPAAADRAAPALGLLVLALQRDQGVDAADGAQRRHRLRRPRRLVLGDGKSAGRRPLGRRRRRRPVRWRSVRRCAWRRLPGRGGNPPRNTAKGRPVWLIPGKRPARFAGSAAGRPGSAAAQTAAVENAFVFNAVMPAPRWHGIRKRFGGPTSLGRMW